MGATLEDVRTAGLASVAWAPLLFPAVRVSAPDRVAGKFGRLCAALLRLRPRLCPLSRSESCDAWRSRPPRPAARHRRMIDPSEHIGLAVWVSQEFRRWALRLG